MKLENIARNMNYFFLISFAHSLILVSKKIDLSLSCRKFVAVASIFSIALQYF